MPQATLLTPGISKGQLIPVRFYQHDVADSQSAVAMNRLEMAGRRAKYFVADGATAGNVTVTGVATTDTLVFVGVFTTKASIATFADLTSEFTIASADTLNNTGGTSTASNQLLVHVDRPNSLSDTLAITEEQIPFDFELAAVSVVSNAARTAGTLTVDVTVDGTVSGLQAALDATNTTRHYTKQVRGSDRASAGSRVGVKLTTSSWTPVTADICVTAWVIASVEGI